MSGHRWALTMVEKIRLGISACLLGQKVRYDGDHSLDPYLARTLSAWVDFVPVCPELEFGLGVPREPIQLEGSAETPRLMTVDTRVELTEGMKAWSRQRVIELEQEMLDGFIFKSKSPSCGLRQVKVFDRDQRFSRIGVGIFAQSFVEHLPLLPAEEERRLRDPAIRESFIDRIFVSRSTRSTSRS